MQTILAVSIRLFVLSIFFTLLVAAAGARAQETSSEDNLEFNYAFAALTNSGGGPQLIAVESDQTLKSGDKLKFYLEALSETYFYLFHLGPGGVLTQIFPGSQQSARLPPDRKVIIPNGNKWLELDYQTGMEKFYLIASHTRQDRLENLYQHHMTLEETDSIQRSTKEILEEMNKIRQKNLSKNAERPVRIGGSFRGPGSNPAEPDPDITNLASRVATTGAYGRFFTIDHQH